MQTSSYTYSVGKWMFNQHKQVVILYAIHILFKLNCLGVFVFVILYVKTAGFVFIWYEVDTLKQQIMEFEKEYEVMVMCIKSVADDFQQKLGSVLFTINGCLWQKMNVFRYCSIMYLT